MLDAILAVPAMARGNLRLGALLQMDSSEVGDWLEERLGWSELCDEGV